MGRRSALDGLDDLWGGPAASPAAAGAPAAAAQRASTLDLIPAAKERTRAAEKRVGGTATYRGIPEALVKRLKGEADRIGVSAGELARWLVEKGVGAMLTGELVIEAQLCAGSLTLYPTWGAQAAPEGKVKRAVKKKKEAERPVTFRGWPVETRQMVSAQAEKVGAPVGQLVRRLIEIGLDKLEAGDWAVSVFVAKEVVSLYV